jgi:hypothetical protein
VPAACAENETVVVATDDDPLVSDVMVGSAIGSPPLESGSPSKGRTSDYSGIRV